MTLLTDYPQNPPSWLDTTKKELFQAERFNPLSNFFYRENSPNMLFLKEPKPSKNSPDE